MAPGLAIRSDIYYAASQKLSTLSTEIGTAVTRDLAPALTTTTGMVGNYPAAVPWATAYLLHATSLQRHHRCRRLQLGHCRVQRGFEPEQGCCA